MPKKRKKRKKYPVFRVHEIIWNMDGSHYDKENFPDQLQKARAKLVTECELELDEYEDNAYKIFKNQLKEEAYYY